MRTHQDPLVQQRIVAIMLKVCKKIPIQFGPSKLKFKLTKFGKRETHDGGGDFGRRKLIIRGRMHGVGSTTTLALGWGRHSRLLSEPWDGDTGAMQRDSKR